MPNRPDEFWWVETCEGVPLEPACISFQGDEPYGITEIGSDYEQPLSRREVRLVERILPPGRVAEVVAKLQEVLEDRCWPGCCALETTVPDLVNEALDLLGPKAEA